MGGSGISRKNRATAPDDHQLMHAHVSGTLDYISLLVCTLD